MGTWGYQPRDSDEALDAYAKHVINPAKRRIADVFGKPTNLSRIRMSRLGLLQIFLEEGHAVPRRVIVQALKDVKLIQQDKRYTKQYDDPESLIAALDHFAKILEELRAHRWSGGKLPKEVGLDRRRKFFAAEV